MESAPGGVSPELAINDAIAVESRHAHRNRLTKLRALIQLARLLTSLVFWGSRVPRGDGYSVLVIPGYGAADLHYIPMRSWLRRLGYRPLRSGISFNAGWSREIVTELGRRVEDEYRERGRRVTLIGHSLGGLQARSVAQRWPMAVRRLVALGAPLRYAGGAVPSNVAITCIYTATDLAYEPAAREQHASNYEVNGTHDLLGVNARVYELLAESLAIPDRIEEMV